MFVVVFRDMCVSGVDLEYPRTAFQKNGNLKKGASPNAMSYLTIGEDNAKIFKDIKAAEFVASRLGADAEVVGL